MDPIGIWILSAWGAVWFVLLAFFPWQWLQTQTQLNKDDAIFARFAMPLFWPVILIILLVCGLGFCLFKFNDWLYTPREPEPLPVGMLLSVNDAGHAVPYKPRRKFPWLKLLGWLWRAAIFVAVSFALVVGMRGGKLPWQ